MARSVVDLESGLEKYCASIVSTHSFRRIERKKIIRDAVLGSHELSPLEVSIIDTPFVQRLRGISQTALTSLTYPSANHSRFEHSLGVSIIAHRMGKALQDNGFRVSKTTIKELRIAGLLHDIGHGPFSHASEEIIKELDEVKDSREKDNRFSRSKPHEMIGYKILQTKAFKDFFDDLLKKYGETDLDLKSISDTIIGYAPNEKHYQADIINGTFDADKLDYLSRDAHFTGLKMAIDTERIFATIMVDERRNKPRRVAVDLGGVHILEQILFNKMLLYPSVYHHHKVRSTVCMLVSVFEKLRDKRLTIDGLAFDKVTDFLSIDDHSLLCSTNKPPEIRDQIEALKGRRLLKRALVISHQTAKTNLENLLKKEDRPSDLREVAKLIADDPKLKGKCEYYDIWIDLPETPRFPEPSQCLIRVTSRDFLDLDKFFPVTEWSDSYAINKWAGFVFGPDDLQKTVSEVSQEVFRDIFDIDFNKFATIQAKHSLDAG